MAVNPYFNFRTNKPEQWLNEDLVIESIKMYGLDVVYIPRDLIRNDKLFGEDILSSFSNPYFVEMYVESVDGFEGAGDMLTRFGLDVRDSAKLVVAKRRFQKETGYTRPKEGDLIYYPTSKGLFEIKFVEHESPFYQLGKNYVFKLSVELFQYSMENIDTGISDIDDKIDDLTYSVFLTLSGVTGEFVKGDKVYQDPAGTWTGSGYASATGATGEITFISPGVTSMRIKNNWGAWGITGTASQQLYVSNAGGTAYAAVTSISDTYDEEDTYNDYASNKTIEDEGDEYINFDESNPFGDL